MKINLYTMVHNSDVQHEPKEINECADETSSQYAIVIQLTKITIAAFYQA